MSASLKSQDDPFAYPCLVPDSPYTWVGIDHPNLDPEHRLPVTARERALVWGGAARATDHPGFDECAVVTVGGSIYLVRTYGNRHQQKERAWYVAAYCANVGPRLVPIFLRAAPIPAYARREVETALMLLMSLTEAPF